MTTTALLNLPAIRLQREAVWNIGTRKVGDLRFVKIGRLTFSFLVSRDYKPFN